MGIVPHQLGCENLHHGRFFFIYQYFNAIHTFVYFTSFCSLFNALTNFQFSFLKFSFSPNSLFISLWYNSTCFSRLLSRTSLLIWASVPWSCFSFSSFNIFRLKYRFGKELYIIPFGIRSLWIHILRPICRTSGIVSWLTLQNFLLYISYLGLGKAASLYPVYFYRFQK